jgi:Flp pilus assembly protein TadD
LYRQLYIQDPEDSRGFIGLTESYMAEGRSSDAVELLQQELAKQPSRTEVRIALANLYVRTEQFESAIDEFKRCLDEAKTQPERADVLYKLGETYRRKGDLNEAIRLFRAAADANPHDARWLLQVALMFDGTGRPEQAAPIYEEILKIQPDNPVALNDLAYILTQKGTDPDRAILLSQRAAQFAKESPEIHDTVGWAYLKKNQSDEAIAEFRKALQSTPNNPKFQFHLAMALLQIGERSAAIQELRAALANHPSKDDEREIRDLLSKIAD